MEPHASPVCQVVLMDGTFASLTEGQCSSIARIHGLLAGQNVQLYYAAGQQWAAWRTVPQLVSGLSLDLNILAAYTWLARNWRADNPLFFFGYSRGGIGVCALADMIHRIGLPTSEHASDDVIAEAWRHYRAETGGRLDPALCHAEVPVQFLGLLDTVMSLGLRVPFLRTVSEPGFTYSKGCIAPNVRRGMHALALDETREAFAPVLWTGDQADERVEQMWFRGCHPDVGGQLGGYEFARPLANVPLVWLLAQAEVLGLPLPQDWRQSLPCDVGARSVGSWRSWGKIFLTRRARRPGRDISELLHPSVVQPYAGPARLVGHLETAQARPRLRRAKLRLPGSGTDSATA
ncbi:Uncharacterized alpha/beta hydrolase domain [Paracoccus laeviglucosivorans]|uniref:Uncharacterized alpha/beta hydrolase domain n=2 Tax=Paracoccus laeviglucosivorans TaxID=1197861 RepID=A0A521FG58_9RHOB|nr:Uncharacterized alpha/beta hydrolase domain [Paracoccus laeviglucosivorans]